uniref:EOG090X0LZH n=1 Tax=Lynceus sp. MCZ IZ 141354 TaxID=1930659 RepID=A0A9N6WZ61_9CRUS|nr:EOG090X0LZH [Lynceus sp. MCZ IZ 141354]
MNGISNNDEDYKEKYRALKRKLRYLVYENEAFASEIRTTEKKLLRVIRDKNYLLDRLLQFEKPANDTFSSDAEATDSSDGETKLRTIQPESKKKKIKPSSNPAVQKKGTPNPKSRKSKNPSNLKSEPQALKFPVSSVSQNLLRSLPGQMTPEEVERHLESRVTNMDFAFAPDKAPPTVPTEMFSNEISSSESVDMDNETSPSYLGEDGLLLDTDN